MTCSGSFATSFFFWTLLSGLCLGFAISRLVRFSGSSDEKAKLAKWTMFSLYLSAAVILAICAAFIPSSVCSQPRRLRVDTTFLDVRLLYLALGAAAVGLLALRFKRAAGLPMLFIVVVGAVAIPAVKYPWSALSADTPVAELRVLSAVDGKRSIEFTPSGGDTYFFELPGTGVAVGAMVLHTSDYYFFVERPAMYRLTHISPLVPDDGASVNLMSDGAVSGDPGGKFQSWLQNLFLKLPGWKVSFLTIESDRLLPLFKYAVFLGGQDGPAITLVLPEE
jgi:hypothetical protein